MIDIYNLESFFTKLEPEISPTEYQTAYPLYCFDTSYQEGRISGNTISINIHFKFSKMIPANTNAYVITFRERVMSITTKGGNKMQIEYINTY